MNNKLSNITVKVTTLLLLVCALLIFLKWSEDNKDTAQISNHLIDISDLSIEYSNHIPYMDIDFTELLKINKETVGWIKINETNINYSVVQAKDNDFYLTNNFEKRKNNAGWMVMDYRNSITELDDNTTIYGHNRLNKSMFSTIKELQKKEWHKKNKYIFFNTLNNKMTWQVFAVYMVPTEEFITVNNFNSKEDKESFIKKAKKTSDIEFNVDVTSDDKILTLYTCNRGNTKRIIVHAKLIFSE
jgi:sortase B